MSDMHRRMSNLSNQVASLQQRLADVSAEYAELIHVLAPFLNRYQHEVLDMHGELVRVQRQIADTQHMLGNTDAADAGAARTALSRLVELDFDTVQEQYERIWEGRDHPDVEIDLEKVLPPASNRLKELYKSIIVRKHPVLIDSPEARQTRSEFMSQVNYAYVRRNEVALQAVADALRQSGDLPAVVDESVVDDMDNLVYRLEQAVMHIEGQIFELRFGDVAKFRAQAAIAHAQGNDLFRDISATLKDELAAAKIQLKELRGRL